MTGDQSGSGGFDPYYSWLGIPRTVPRPPDHYTLLGLPRFEGDPEMIAAFADKQMTFVQTFKTGPHSAASQKLLNELSQARLTLLNAEKRAKYDETLRAQLAAAEPAGTTAPAAAAPLGPRPAAPAASEPNPLDAFSSPFPEASLPSATLASPPAMIHSSVGPRGAKPAGGFPVALAGAAVGVVAALSAFAVFFLTGKPKDGVITLAPKAGVRLAEFVVDGRPVAPTADGSWRVPTPPGSHEVKLVRAGFRDHVETVASKSGETVEIRPTWQPQSIVVLALSETDRAGVRIELDGRPLAVEERTLRATPDEVALAIEPGSHALRGVGGDRSFEAPFQATPGREARVAPRWIGANSAGSTPPVAIAAPPRNGPPSGANGSSGDSIELLRATPLDQIIRVAGRPNLSADRVEFTKYLGARIQFPTEIAGRDYAFRTRLTRVEGVDAAVVMLPVGSGECTLILNGWADQGGKTCLSQIDGVSGFHHPTAVAGDVLQNGVPTELEVTVRRVEEGRRAVAVRLGEKELFTVTAAETSFTHEPYWKPENKRLLGLGAYDSHVIFENPRLTFLSPPENPPSFSGAPSDPPPPPAAVASTDPVDVLRWLVAEQVSIVKGTAKITPGRIEIEPADCARVELPLELKGLDYVFSARFTRLDGGDCATFSLPIGDVECTLMFNGWSHRGGMSFMSLVDGREGFQDPRCVKGQVIKTGVPNDVKASVRRVGDKRWRIAVDFNGRPFFDETFDESSLSQHRTWALNGRGRLGLGAWNSRTVFEDLWVRTFESGRLTDEIAARPVKPTAGGSGSPGATPNPLSRIPVPSAEDQTQAEKLLRDAMQKQFEDAKDAESRIALADSLLGLARQEGDPSNRFVMRRAAHEQALAGRDYALAATALRRQAEEFEISAAKTFAAALERVEEDAKTTADRKSLVAAARRAADDAVVAEELDAAVSLLATADRVATKARLAAEKKELQTRSAELAALRKLFATVPAARETLLASPDDPAANDAVGRWLCEGKLDFAAGLPLIARGPGSLRKDLAERDLKNPNDGFERIALGDAWYNVGQGEKDAARRATLVRAGHWYRLALPSTVGLVKSKLEARLKEIEPLLPAPAEHDVAVDVRPGGPNRPAATDSGEGSKPRPSSSAPGVFALNGLTGDRSVPVQLPNGWSAPRVFAEVSGEGKAEARLVPASSYALEIDFTLHNVATHLKFMLGDRGAGSEFCIGQIWDKDKGMTTVPARLFRVNFGGVTWWSNAEFPVGERQSVRVLVCDDVKAVFQGDKQILWAPGPAHDLKLRISSNREASATIHRCEARPITAEEAALIKRVAPDARPPLDDAAAAKAIEERNADLKDRPQPGEPFLVATTRTRMLWVAPGEITLGQTGDAEADREATFQPASISRGYWLGACEVTQAEWEKLFKENPSRDKSAPTLPVNWISLTDVARFCQKLNQLEARQKRIPAGYEYRAPTEAEWEYACRAGKPGRHAVPEAEFWHAGTSGRRLQPVGQKTPNAWGFFDMHGNAPEWCLDKLEGYPRGAAPVVDRFVPGKPDDAHAIRGGGFFNGPEDCTTVARGRMDGTIGTSYFGFRLALAPSLSNP